MPFFASLMDFIYSRKAMYQLAINFDNLGMASLKIRKAAQVFRFFICLLGAVTEHFK